MSSNNVNPFAQNFQSPRRVRSQAESFYSESNGQVASSSNEVRSECIYSSNTESVHSSRTNSLRQSILSSASIVRSVFELPENPFLFKGISRELFSDLFKSRIQSTDTLSDEK